LLLISGNLTYSPLHLEIVLYIDWPRPHCASHKTYAAPLSGSIMAMYRQLCGSTGEQHDGYKNYASASSRTYIVLQMLSRRSWIQISAVFFNQRDQVVRNPLSTSFMCSIPGTWHVLHLSDGACSGKERVKCKPCSRRVFSSFLNKPSVSSLDSDFWLFEREYIADSFT
jgi:hypothetical protein